MLFDGQMQYFGKARRTADVSNFGLNFYFGKILIQLLLSQSQK